MTFYHFGNCLALSYIPYYLTYKYSGLSDYGAFWKCFQTGIFYALTQLCKMLILATFFPVPIQEQDESANLFKQAFGLEFLKTTIDLADFIGLYLALSRIPGRGHAKILSAALGWGATELVFTKFLALWFGARGAEFNWKYIQMCLDSNIGLVQIITTTTLIWLWSRHDLKQAFVPIVCIMLVVGAYKNLIFDSFISVLWLGPWFGLLTKAIVTCGLGLATLRVYSSVQ